MAPQPNPSAAPAGDRASQTAPAPEPAAAADPEARTRSLVRQNQWLTRFWMELTPAQQARVQRQLRSGNVVLAADRADPAAAWDSMGLSDRARMVFGTGQSLDRPVPADRRDSPAWARSY